MFGSRKGTQQSLQLSFFVVHKDDVVKFINRLHAIKRDDKTFSPENKFAVATNPILSIFPPRFLHSRIGIRVASILGNSETLPIGYGHTRSINY